MRRTIIAIVITAAATSLVWDVATGLRKGRDKLWLMSAVTVPGRMALDEIAAETERGDYAAAKGKLEILRNLWRQFDSDNSFSSAALGNVMVEFSRLPNSATNAAPNTASHGTASPVLVFVSAIREGGSRSLAILGQSQHLR